MFFSSAALKRSSRTRSRKNTTAADTDIEYSSPRSSDLSRRKSRPPPLQIISESLEDVLDISAAHSPATARPTQYIPQQPELVPSRITLSAYTFSIDDTLITFAGDAPRSPALSASSSTSDSASSEDVPPTPGTSDGEGEYDTVLHTPRLHPQRISIRPLCITKTRSLICREDGDTPNYLEKEEEKVAPLQVTEESPGDCTDAMEATDAAQEAEHDFYAREFEDFISLFSAAPSPTSPARRDSLILVDEVLSAVVEVPGPKYRGRSRLSKPLPLLPPVTPPISSFPPVPSFSLVQTSSRNSIVRRQCQVLVVPDYPPTPTLIVSRPLPRMSVPLDIEDCVSSEEGLSVPSDGPMTDQVYDIGEDARFYSRPSLTYTISTSICPPPVSETPHPGMYGEVTLPRSSTDSDAPRSSTDSTSSLAPSMASDTAFSPFSYPRSPSCEEHLRSRWSSSTLASIAAEPPRAATLFSPLKGVFSSRARRTPPPPQKMFPLTAPKLPRNKLGFPLTPSPPRTSCKHIPRQRSRSSTSSGGTSSSECDSRDGSPSRLKRKPIPVAMFSRAT